MSDTYLCHPSADNLGNGGRCTDAMLETLQIGGSQRSGVPELLDRYRGGTSVLRPPMAAETARTVTYA
jgi:hypothetical protein